jgi:tartrate dehydrogenase/decarboxylase/D-malate dehydrogenase
VQDHVTLNGLLLPIRRRFDQCVCVRPAYLYPGVQSPLSNKPPGSIDLVVFRENTEGEYANIGGRLYQGTAEEVAVQTSVFTRRGCERIIRAAFEKARLRPRKKIASITKSNAQGYGMVLWDEVFAAVAQDFPEVATESLLVDRAVMEFVRRPESFDVVVASNLFGDILTDLAAILVGSMGLAASANLDPTRRYPSMFEPVHGSAPDIAGRGIANPLAAILSAGMMLEHLELDAAAAAVKQAVASLLAESGPRTADLGGISTTADVGTAIVKRIQSSVPH